MIVFAPAKINLGLNIVKKRADGYHELETVMLPIPLYDVLEILPQKDFQWKQSGLLIDGQDDSNLCIRAFRFMQKNYNIPNIYLHLRKQIPMGAGLGGGSSDAASVVKALNSMFTLNISITEQQQIVGSLGSDCPFFIEEIPQLATGKGEVLAPASISTNGLYLVLIKPSIHINTAQAYNGVFISGDQGNLLENLQQPIESWKTTIKNDFEHHIFASHPLLDTLKSELYAQGALYASMSGSGSTMYGLFAQKPNFQTRVENCSVYNLDQAL